MGAFCSRQHDEGAPVDDRKGCTASTGPPNASCAAATAPSRLASAFAALGRLCSFGSCLSSKNLQLQ